MEQKIMTIGGAMQDLFYSYKTPPETIELERDTGTEHFIILPEGRKIEVADVKRSVGGGATNSAVSFKRLGFSVTSLFKVGNDDAGSMIVEHLKKIGIDTKYVLTSRQVPTGNSIILPTPSGNRTCLVYRGANATLNEQELSLDAIQQYPNLYITSLSGQVAFLLPIIVKAAKKSGSFIASNPGTSQLTENVSSLIDALPFIDVLIVNFHEAQLLLTSLQKSTHQTTASRQKSSDEIIEHLKRYFKEIMTKGPRIAVVTHGKDGVYASDGAAIYFHPSIKTHIVSTLGAGDAFASTFVAQLIQEKSIPDALQAGVLNSAHVLHYADTQKGLLLAHELEVEQKKLNKNLIQTFIL